MVFLMADHVDIPQDHIACNDEFVSSRLCGRAYLLHVQSTKAKRVSYSTSHGETPAAMNGLDCATLLSTRLSEVSLGDKKLTLHQLLAIQERGNGHWLVDMMTDCRESQRIYLLAIREARLCGRVRWNIYWFQRSA